MSQQNLDKVIDAHSKKLSIGNETLQIVLIVVKSSPVIENVWSD